MPKCDFNKVALQLIEITLWHVCSPVNLLHIFRTPFYKNTSGSLLLKLLLHNTNKQTFNDKAVTVRCLVQYRQIFSSFLIFCRYLTRLKAREIMK